MILYNSYTSYVGLEYWAVIEAPTIHDKGADVGLESWPCFGYSLTLSFQSKPDPPEVLNKKSPGFTSQT